MAIRPRHRPTACWIRAWTFRGKTRVRVCEDADPNFFAQGACNTRARVLGAYGARVLHAPHLPPSTRRKGPMHLLPFDFLANFSSKSHQKWTIFWRTCHLLRIEPKIKAQFIHFTSESCRENGEKSPSSLELGAAINGCPPPCRK